MQNQNGTSSAQSVASPLLSQQEVEKLIALVYDSDLKESDKVFYIHTIVEGLFSLELLDEVLQKLDEASKRRHDRKAELEQENAALTAQIQSAGPELKEAMHGAVDEITSAVDHIEQATFKHIQTLKDEDTQKQIETIKLKINAQ